MRSNTDDQTPYGTILKPSKKRWSLIDMTTESCYIYNDFLHSNEIITHDVLHKLTFRQHLQQGEKEDWKMKKKNISTEKYKAECRCFKFRLFAFNVSPPPPTQPPQPRTTLKKLISLLSSFQPAFTTSWNSWCSRSLKSRLCFPRRRSKTPTAADSTCSYYTCKYHTLQTRRESIPLIRDQAYSSYSLVQ
jgi:hypothetical protein